MHLKDINFIRFIEDDNIIINFGSYKRLNTELYIPPNYGGFPPPILLI